MANTGNMVSDLPLVPDFVAPEGRGGAIFRSREQSEQVVALGRAFADLFTTLWNGIRRMDTAITEAQTMRQLANLDDRTLRDIGISRGQLPGMIAGGELAEGFDHAVARLNRKY